MKAIAWAVGALALCLPACAHTHVATVPTEAIGDWAGTLLPAGNARIRGATAARSGLGETGISVTIAGAEPGSTHPWRVGVGDCASPGPPVGAVDSYPVLRVNSGGNASASARLRVAFAADARYYVSVYESPARPEVVIACGPIHRTGV